MKKLLNISLLFAAVVVLFASCAKEDPIQVCPEGPETPAAKFVIKAPLSRANADPVSDDEKITSWWVAFVDANRKVAKVVSRPATLTAAVEQESFETDVDNGTYWVYSFANLTPAEVSATTGLIFTEGATIASVQALEAATMTMINGFKPSVAPNHGIPMTGAQLITITSRNNQPYSVEVVRTVAKMEFSFTNECDYAVKINKIAMNPLNKGVIPVFPNYSTLANAPTILAAATTERFEHTCSGVTVPVGDKGSTTETFFVRESRIAADHPTGHFSVGLNVTRGDGTVEEQLYSLMADDFTWIQRNDWVKVPIVLTDVLFRPEVWFYPPIGGYPPADIEEKDDRDFYCTFRSAGDFVIVPKVSRGANSNLWIPLNDTSKILSYNIAVSDPQSILGDWRDVTHMNNTGELLGAVNGTKGTAVLTFTIKVKINETLSRDFTRRIYITVK